MKNFKQFVTEHQNKFFHALLVIWVISMIGLIVCMRLDLKRNEQKTKEAVEQLVDAMDRAVHMTYDTWYVYRVGDYRVDVMCNDSLSYRKLIFRTDYEGIPETFVVNISPASDYKQFEADIISRFIDVHEHERTICYEFYTDANGRKTCSVVCPFTDEFNVYIAYHLAPDGKNKIPFLRRKGTDFGYKLENTNKKQIDIWE